ncbi:nephrin-like [Dermatophagoides farinae]|uniref:Nephrin-like n=1 Tax=Dermatophagoides farinae TaxID=6954 RepID=A0A9D4NVI2_DERFA|nr:nephrin-like [Dermatophagoides farinae]
MCKRIIRPTVFHIMPKAIIVVDDDESKSTSTSTLTSSIISKFIGHNVIMLLNEMVSQFILVNLYSSSTGKILPSMPSLRQIIHQLASGHYRHYNHNQLNIFSTIHYHIILPFLLYILLLIQIQIPSTEPMWIIDNTSYNAIINGEIALPCNITSPSFDDGVSLVLWYRDDIATPIYTVDARQSSSLERAQHFLHTDIFDQRATFNISYPLAFLLIKHVRPNDGGDYRCRVDFRRARTVNRILKLTVIVPTSSVIIYDQNFTIIDKIAGPFEEDSTQSLICDSSEGNPLPVVHWWRGSNLIDSEYYIINNSISRNVLTLNNLSRDDLQLSLTCQAYNTNLTVPIVKTITLDLYLKPKEIRIITPMNNITTTTTTTTTATPIELACQCSGSRPAAKIKWKKHHHHHQHKNGNDDDEQQEWLDAYTQIISNDGLTTTSFLSFVPSIDDNGKNITCIGYNPQISQSKYSIENSWLINITYAPILSLIMGSDSQSQDIVEGSNVYFECDIKANPYVTTFGWKLNGQILDMLNISTWTTTKTTTSSSNSMKKASSTIIIDGVEMRNTSLLVTNVNHEHYGHYQCFASNRIGSSQSESVFLNVKYTPKCKHKTIVDIGVAIDETVTIECQVLANPVNVRFEWWMESWPSSSLSNDSNNYNDGYSNNNHTADIKRMKVKTITSYTSVGLQSIAKYRTASQNDYGHLYCRATNLVGRQDKPCVFHIIKAEAPSHPHNCSLVNKTAHSLTVECSPGYSGGLEQTFFLQVYSLNPNRLLKNLSNTQQPYFSIDDLPAGYLFKLVIYSSNRKGTSKSIEITGSTTEPSPWKSAEYPAMDISSTLTPFALVIIVIVIIVILFITILVHIRNRIKGRMRTVIQTNDSHHHKPANITPKSIMKKQKSWDITASNVLTTTASVMDSTNMGATMNGHIVHNGHGHNNNNNNKNEQDSILNNLTTFNVVECLDNDQNYGHNHYISTITIDTASHPDNSINHHHHHHNHQTVPYAFVPSSSSTTTTNTNTEFYTMDPMGKNLRQQSNIDNFNGTFETDCSFTPLPSQPPSTETITAKKVEIIS